jgi:hypothetical protein
MAEKSIIAPENKWICAIEPSGSTRGFNQGSIMHFQGEPFIAFIREMVQNSIDANRGLGFIKVIIQHLIISRKDIPDVDGLVDIIKLCKDSETEDEKVQQILDRAVDQMSAEEIHVLQFSDYNTKGLEGSVLSVKTPAHAFMKAEGVTNKGSRGATGSFGIGKFAQYILSTCRAAITTSVSLEPEGYRVMVQGKSILRSHTRFNEELDRDVVYREEAFFGPDDGNFDAAYNYDNVPGWLVRGDGSLGPDTQGTTLSILGFKHQDDWKELMVGVTIQNYFGAILAGTLDIEIGGIEINKDTIQTLFTDPNIVNAIRDAGCYEDFENSYAYYKCLTDDRTIVETVNVPNLGTMSLSILVDRELPRQVVFNRNGMKITDQMSGLKRFRMLKPFSCVVEPIDEMSRETLRQMEPPAHDNFHPHIATDQKVARAILKALETTVKQFIDKHAGFTASQESNVTELSDILADTTDDQNGESGEFNIRGAVKIIDETKTLSFGGRKYGSVSVGTLSETGETESVSGGKSKVDGPPNPPGPPPPEVGLEPSSGNGFSVSTPATLDPAGKVAVVTPSEGEKAVRMHVKHRGVLRGKRQFKLETLVNEPVKLEIAFQRNGLSESDDLVVVSSSVGTIVNGKVHVELDQNNSLIDVTFDRDFRGGSVGIVAHAI